MVTSTRARFRLEAIVLYPVVFFGLLSSCSHRSFSYKTRAVGRRKPCSQQTVPLLDFHQKSTVAWPPVITPHPTYEVRGSALDAQRLGASFFFVHFLMKVWPSRSCSSLNAFLFCLSVNGIAGKARFFSQSKLFCSLKMVYLDTAGLPLSVISFRKCVRVLNFTKRTSCRSRLLFVSFTFLGCLVSSYRSISVPARMFLTTRYTVAKGTSVHLENLFDFQIPSQFFQNW